MFVNINVLCNEQHYYCCILIIDSWLLHEVIPYQRSQRGNNIHEYRDAMEIFKHNNLYMKEALKINKSWYLVIKQCKETHWPPLESNEKGLTNKGVDSESLVSRSIRRQLHTVACLYYSHSLQLSCQSGIAH